MIRRIQALNYRCLRYADVPLDRFHVMVGPNCRDAAFNELKRTLRTWFPPDPEP